MTEPQPNAPGRASSSLAEHQVIHRALAAGWRVCEMGTRQEIWREASAELHALTGADVICLDADRAGRLIPESSPTAVDRNRRLASAIAGRLGEAWHAHRAPALIELEHGRVLAATCTDTRNLRGGLALVSQNDEPFTRDDQAVLALVGQAAGHALGALAVQATSVPLERYEAALSGHQAELGHTLHSGPAQDLAMATMALEHLLSADAGLAVAEDARIALAYVAFAGENLRQFIAQLRGEAPEERAKSVPSPATASFFPDIRQEDAMLAIVREAIRNSRAHAQAETVTITVTRDQGALTVGITDDGQGFSGAAPAGHFGLAEMRDLAGAMGGEIVISSTPGMGTTIHLTVPASPVTPIKRPVEPTTLETPPHDPE
jgi:signal transduction histidine kinase